MPINSGYEEVRQLNLPAEIICTRTYPVTKHGDELLRACRRTITENLERASGGKIHVPFPTALYMVLRDYAEIKGITITDADRISPTRA